MTVEFMRLPVAAGNDWWAVTPGCLFRHARLFVLSCSAPTGHLLRLRLSNKRLSCDGKLKEIVLPRQTGPSEAFFLVAGWWR